MSDWMASRRREGGGGGKRLDPTRPASVWRERELLDGEEVDAMVAVLRTRGCSHERACGGCTMCGYASETPARPPTEEELLSQVSRVAGRLDGERWVKLYTSGSMLDPEEVPPTVLEAIVEAFGDADRMTVESRAEHVTEERVMALGDASRVEVAIGLESASDVVLERSVNKGMTVADYRRGAEAVRAAGAMLRTYVLLKPAFLTEAEAIMDAIAAVEVALEAGSSVVSVNPVNVQGATLVDHLHRRWEYEPPWLWSVVEVLAESDWAAGAKGARVLSAPTAGGRTRGAHNCGGCDDEVLRAIEFYRLGGGLEELRRVPDCRCRQAWRLQLELEGLEQGPFAPRDYRGR